MKVKILTTLLALFSTYNYACTEQIKYSNYFNNKNNILDISIERLDKKEFSYYTIPTYIEDIFIGFKMEDERYFDLRFETLKEGLGGPSLGKSHNDENYAQKLHKFWRGKGNSLSTYYYYLNTSTVYSLPLTKKVNVFKYKKTIDLNEYMNVFNNILIKNNISGEQKIKFYVKLLHEQENNMSCSYFESQSFIYNFDNLSKDINLPNYNEKISTNTEKIDQGIISNFISWFKNIFKY